MATSLSVEGGIGPGEVLELRMTKLAVMYSDLSRGNMEENLVVKVAVNGRRVFKVDREGFPGGDDRSGADRGARRRDAASVGRRYAFNIGSDPRTLLSSLVTFSVFQRRGVLGKRRLGWAAIDAASLVTGSSHLELPLRPEHPWPSALLRDDGEKGAERRGRRARSVDAGVGDAGTGDAWRGLAKYAAGYTPAHPRETAPVLVCDFACEEESAAIHVGTDFVGVDLSPAWGGGAEPLAVAWSLVEASGGPGTDRVLAESRFPPVPAEAGGTGPAFVRGRGPPTADVGFAVDRGASRSDVPGSDHIATARRDIVGLGDMCVLAGGPWSLRRLTGGSLHVVVRCTVRGGEGARSGNRGNSASADTTAAGTTLVSDPIPLAELLPEIDPFLPSDERRRGSVASHVALHAAAAPPGAGSRSGPGARSSTPPCTATVVLWFAGLPRYANLVGGTAAGGEGEERRVRELGIRHTSARRDARVHVYGATLTRKAPILVGMGLGGRWSVLRGDIDTAPFTTMLNFVHLAEVAAPSARDLRFAVAGGMAGLLHPRPPRPRHEDEESADAPRDVISGALGVTALPADPAERARAPWMASATDIDEVTRLPRPSRRGARRGDPGIGESGGTRREGRRKGKDKKRGKREKGKQRTPQSPRGGATKEARGKMHRRPPPRSGRGPEPRPRSSSPAASSASSSSSSSSSASSSSSSASSSSSSESKSASDSDSTSNSGSTLARSVSSTSSSTTSETSSLSLSARAFAGSGAGSDVVWDEPVWERVRLFVSSRSPISATEGHRAVVVHDGSRMLVFGGGAARTGGARSHAAAAGARWGRNTAVAAGTMGRFSNVVSEFRFDRLAAEGVVEAVGVEPSSGAGDHPVGRTGHTWSPIGSSRFVAFGGSGGPVGTEDRGGRINSAHLYDAAAKTWRPIATSGAPPPPRARHSACVLRGALFVFGGRSNYNFLGGSYFDDLWRLDLDTWVWTQVHPRGRGPAPRCGHAAVADASGRFMIIFGGFREPSRYYSDVHIYDAARDSWRTVEPAGDGPSPPGREAHGAVLVRGGSTLLTGLGNGLGGTLNDVWLFDIPRRTWRRAADTGFGPSARAGASMAVVRAPRIADECVVLYGGDTGFSMSREIFVLHATSAFRTARAEDAAAITAAPSMRTRDHVILDGPVPETVLLEVGRCCVCLDRRVEVVLVPCSHAALCRVCVLRLDSCPLCRADVSSVVALPNHRRAAGVREEETEKEGGETKKQKGRKAERAERKKGRERKTKMQ